MTSTGEHTYSSAIAYAYNYMEWVLTPFKPLIRGDIVEIGIGHGSYCEVLRRQGRYLGVDSDEASVRAARQRFPGISFDVCDILDKGALQRTIPNGVDTIICINVLEHIEDDATAVTNLINKLNTGGHLMLSVPALDALYNDLDRLAGHYRRYTRRQLSKLLEPHQSQLRVLRLCYFNPLGGFGWWVNSFRKYASLNSDLVTTQIRLFDRYAVPISRILDPLFRSFFGQSVICIARRI